MKFQNRFSALALFCAASALPFAAQAQPAAAPSPVPVQTQQQPVAAPPIQPGTIAAEPAPLPPPQWNVADVQELLTYIQAVAKEGLDPADYDPNGLAAALQAGNPIAFSAASTERFNRLSTDLALGHVRGKDRVDWWIKDPDLDNGRQDQLLRWALQSHHVAETLESLLPTHPQYAALRHALEVTPPTETDKINRIRLNMDRWRWLPHDLGERYIIVNVPAYTAALVEKGETLSRHHAVAGKISTPTPQLSAVATGVILNPWWEIPASIAGEVAGKNGFVALKDDNGKIIRWRQPPGPTNALGQVKFVMPNSKAIYLHDTNAKSRFNSKVRAFSHGCIRTQDILKLATILLEEPAAQQSDPLAPSAEKAWTAERINQVLASGKSVQANFPQPLPVYIVYMSSAATVDGRIIDYPDIYKRDGKVIASLLNSKPHARDAGAAAKPGDKVATR